MVVAAAVLVLRHGDKGPFLAADDLHAANGKYAVDVHIGVGEGVLAVLHGIDAHGVLHGERGIRCRGGSCCLGLGFGHWDSSFSDLDMKKAPGQVLISQAHIHFLLGCKLDLLEADAVAVIELTAAFIV